MNNSNSNSNSSKQVLLSVIGVAILVIAVVGVSFAFFNYTRTGTANTVKTGQIFFEQSHNTVQLTNVFPVTSSDAAAVPGDDAEHPVSNPSVGYVDITVHGYTTYANGVDFTVKAVNVNASSSVGNGGTDIDVPFTVDVTADGFDDSSKATITTTSYGPNYTGREVLEENATLASGKIKAGGSTSNNFTGHIYIRAYLDAANIAISDTYPPGDVTHTEGEEPNQTTVTDYTNGTTTQWVNGRTVLTTEQWNSLSTTPLSFKVRVEANEGASS